MHRRSSHRALIYFTPLLCALAFVAFPAAASAAAPVNTAAPTITIPPGGASTEISNPTEGRTLTSTPGTWNPAQTKFVYQWTYNCTLPVPPTIAGNPGTSIPGATNAVYKVAHGDIGNTLCLTVSAGGSAPVIASNMTGVVAAGNPIDRVAPSVSGITNDGQTLTASPGTWDGTAPITFTYAWRECDSAGKNCGAVFTAPSASPTYVLQDRDLGHTMSVVVTASNSVLPAVPLGSFATAGVVSPGNNAPPTISGTPQQGKTLTESHGIWVPGSPSYSYQWQVCDTSGATCSAIPGATSQTYKLGSSDVGHTVVVHEMATAGGVTSAPASSAASGLVQGLPSNNGGSNGGGSNGGGQNGGGSNGGGQPQGSSSFSSVKIHGLLMNALGARGKGANIRALLKHGGYSFSFAAPSAGRLQVLWYRLVHGRRLLVGTVTFTFRKAGSAKIEIRVTRTGRNLLRHAGKLRLTASAGFTPVGLGTTLASRTITLNG
jgi:hypothetical protein